MTRSQRVFGIALVSAALLLLAPLEASAQSAPRKLGRGLAAMTCGFLELPGNIVKETRARGAGVGVPLGFAKGLGGIVVRELVGVYEFLTAPMPWPAGYKPILEPEFPWDYFEQAAPKRAARSEP
jgi:putative exosortase-associated protein (TIGR04073 family)